MKNTGKAARRLAVTMVGVLALALSACGGEEPADKAPAAKGNPTEQAFLRAMAPHHESATDMAEVARERGESPTVKRIAGDIMATQPKEVAQMRRIHQRLFGGALQPDPMAHEALGLSPAEAGMMDMEQSMMRLETADPFDREFADEMVTHHRGAILMAEALLRKGRDPELRKLAEEMIAAQQREVRELNDFRKKEFGSPVPESPMQM